MQVPKFASVGDNCVDRFLPPVNMSLDGGNAVNVAVQLAMLGCDSAYFGAVGDDDAGRHLSRLLQDNRVDIGHLVIRNTNTAYTDIRTLPDGDRQIVVEDFGACDGYAPTGPAREALREFTHVHLGWLNDGGALRRQLLEWDVAVSQDISVNANPEDIAVEGLSIAFASAGNDEALGRKMLADLLTRGVRLAIVTLGSAGSLASDGSRTFKADIAPAKALDTTGAGDSFIAGFIAAHVSGNPIETCMRQGAERAARTCEHLGGFPQTPRQTLDIKKKGD